MASTTLSSFTKNVNDLNKFYVNKGFEVAAFKIGSYNKIVGKSFQLPHSDDTMALVVISHPAMFEKVFIPFINEAWTNAVESFDPDSDDEEQRLELKMLLNNLDIEVNCDVLSKLQCFFSRQVRDPIDECMKVTLRAIAEKLPYKDIEILHDFELTPMRRPKILVQTAGHVSGAVTMYRQDDLHNFPPHEKDDQLCTSSAISSNGSDQRLEVSSALVDTSSTAPKKLFPVCLHPNYGGWFSLRGVIILKDVKCADFVENPSREMLTTRDQVLDVLVKFNQGLQNWSFRDVVPVLDRYSDLQQRYFSTRPKDRKEVILKILLESKLI